MGHWGATARSLFTAAIAALLVPAASLPAAAGDTTAVIELYTSQGCSSCPPADKLAAELNETRADLLVLSLAVDYWDFLGWTDTLASSENSDRQRKYAVRRGDQRVYTPQMVINGREHLVGSSRPQLEQALAFEKRHFGPLPVDVELTVTATSIDVSLTPMKAGKTMATVWALPVSSQVEVQIGAGENSGRTIHYTNVVRKMLPVGMFEGQPMTLRLPTSELMGPGVDSVAVLVQQDSLGVPGPILGGRMVAAPLQSALRR